MKFPKQLSKGNNKLVHAENLSLLYNVHFGHC